jgi:MFS transporter, putative metabolite:H+ symporter
MGLGLKLSIGNSTRLTILIATLGYFVDLFDLILFSLVRVQSLKDLGVPQAQTLAVGLNLLNVQMAGLIIGGILWGILGDRRGRLSVLVGSILLYSLANLANAFVTSVPMYAALRLFAGIGLAGELGAGVCIVSELLPQKYRGYGSTIIASVGVFGAVFAAVVADHVSWRHAYMIGGVIGLVLLAMRLGIRESTLFARMKQSNVARGRLLPFIRRPDFLARVGLIVLVGVPIWFVIGILVTLTKEFSEALHMTEIPKVTTAILYLYVGFGVGDFAIGLLSQALKSRRYAVLASLSTLSVLLACYTHLAGSSLHAYYSMCFAFGCGAGYWAMFVQIASEQFGTNYRATVTTSVPNLVRGSTILMTTAFKALIPAVGVIGSGLTVGFTVIVIAVIATIRLEETFHRELDFNEAV